MKNKKYNQFNFPMFCQTETVFWGEGKTAARAESEAFDQGHPLSERDRAKKDYGRSPTRAEVRSTSIRVGRPPGQKCAALHSGES